MRSVAALTAAALALSLPQLAAGQPGQTTPGEPPPPPPGPAPQPGWGAPASGWGASQAPPTNYHLLTPEERQLLLRGEISDGEHVAGGLVGTFVGWGIGHAVQGRFHDKGWIFLVGEGASLAAIFTFALRCADSADEDTCDDNAGLLVAGVLGMVVFRVWETIDVWVGPSRHNEKVRRARAKAYGVQPVRQWSFHVLPTSSEGTLSGATAGVSWRF